MRKVVLGKTGIEIPQNAFGALPIQRADMTMAVKILRTAYDGGMRFFDTARVYTDSEEKIGVAFKGMREKIYIASKTMAKTPEDFWKELNVTLSNLKTDYLDLYQFHCVTTCYVPGDGSGMYECMLEAKKQGKIRHIGITSHQLKVAFDIVASGFYETLQFPLSYLSNEKEIELVQACKEAGVGFIAMKGLAGGLIHRSDAAMAFMTQFDNVLPIWGIQKMSELEEWISYMEETPTMTDDLKKYIAKEKKELSGDFCRGCGYCMPCPVDIQINNCARISLLLRRAPSENWLSKNMQLEMKKIENCLHCMKCANKCPYGLDTPALLEKNYEDYKNVLEGNIII